MQAWLDINYVRARCDELRADAARERIARGSRGARRGVTRRRIARSLLALGSFFVAAANRVGGDLAVDC